MPPDRTGITQTAHGWRVYVRVRPYQASRHFPAGTPLRDLLEARDELRVELRKQRDDAGRQTPTAGTFAADVVRYLEAVRAMPTYRARAWLMERWADRFGTWHRHDITAADIRTALADWSDTYSPRTLLLLRGALRHLWHVLDGKAASNPVRDVPAPRGPDDLPRAIPLEALCRIALHLEPSRSRSILWLMATTGLPPSEIARLRRQDWRGDRLTTFGRRKGAGTRPRTVPLTRHAQAALRSMDRTGAWGGVRDCLRGIWRKAKARAGYAKQDWRVYDLRHTFLTEMARGGDDMAVAYLAGHSRLDMTRRYTLGAVPERVSRLIASVIAKGGYNTSESEKLQAKAQAAKPRRSRPKTGENALKSSVQRGESS